MRSTRSNPRPRLLGGAALLLAGACGGDESDEAADQTTTTSATRTQQQEPSLTILSREVGAKVGGYVVKLDLDVDGLRIVKADGDVSGQTGHYHVFVDKDPVAPGAVIPREAGVVHTTEDPVELPGLAAGRHRFTVVLGNGAHARIGETEAEVSVEVVGPSIDATAPASASAGEPVKVETKAEGVQIVKGGNHLHLFVDRERTPRGAPIPQGDPFIIHTPEMATELPGLAPGEHVIWVVVGDAAHVPLDPPVADKVTVTVE